MQKGRGQTKQVRRYTFRCNRVVTTHTRDTLYLALRYARQAGMKIIKGGLYMYYGIPKRYLQTYRDQEGNQRARDLLLWEGCKRCKTPSESSKTVCGTFGVTLCKTQERQGYRLTQYDKRGGLLNHWVFSTHVEARRFASLLRNTFRVGE